MPLASVKEIAERYCQLKMKRQQTLSGDAAQIFRPPKQRGQPPNVGANESCVKNAKSRQ